jgi:tRNA-splicing ligase RtcB
MKRIILDTPVPVKIWANDIEQAAVNQLRNLSTLPFIHSHVAAMADAHSGKGSTVGTVIATKGAIIPAAVGVDIGCGMAAVKLPFKIDVFDRLAELRANIERRIPVGHYGNSKAKNDLMDRFNKLGEVTLKDRVDLDKALLQVGTLGGGNHFIELCFDQNNDAWIMLHSGSRNIGKSLAEVHIEKAKGLMKQYFIKLPDPDLAYLTQDTPEFKAYIQDLLWGQRYAKLNRDEMVRRVLEAVSYHLFNKPTQEKDLTVLRVDCHHNYTSMENHFGANVWITRKGAVSARAGELGIIPGSMGNKSYIVEGLGNPQSFCSCSHGAGRSMSRSKAKERFTEDDLLKQTAGVECRKDRGVLDEIPGAYKNIDDVMKNQEDLVKPLYTLKQVMCIKGN